MPVTPQVSKQAAVCMLECCYAAGNRDLEATVPALVSCISRPAEVAECIHKLAGTTFVQAVEAPALAVICPLLIRGLRERITSVKRKAALIIANMAKLVEDPQQAAPFLPLLLELFSSCCPWVPFPALASSL